MHPSDLGARLPTVNEDTPPCGLLVSLFVVWFVFTFVVVFCALLLWRS